MNTISLNDSKIKAIISNIRNIRECKGYSQFYLATKLGISQNAYSKIELGYSNITLDRLLKIAEILETDIVELLNCAGNQSLLKAVNNLKK